PDSTSTAGSTTLPAEAQEALATQRLYINASEESQAVGLIKAGDPIVVLARTRDSNWLYVAAVDSQLEGFVKPSILGLNKAQVTEQYEILGQ
ncbi:MAG: SH3 domain-containing protein, partial [Anaerolineales bacterium]|nr:SH3 domain-containing protein [Anaerolineales bacterium]